MGTDWDFKMWRRAIGPPKRWSLLDAATRVGTYARDAPRSLSFMTGETRAEERFQWSVRDGKPQPPIKLEGVASAFLAFDLVKGEAEDEWPELHVFVRPAEPLSPWLPEPVESLAVGFRYYSKWGENAKLDLFIALCLAEVVVRMDPEVAAGGVESYFHPTPDEFACGYPRYQIPEVGYFPPAVVRSKPRAVWEEFAHVVVEGPGLVREADDEPERGSVLHIQNGGILYRREQADGFDKSGVLHEFMRRDLNMLV